MFENKKEITSGDNSTNVQGKNVNLTTHTTHNNGIDYFQARQIAIDVFKANFFELSQTAHEVSLQRAEELSDKLITRLKSENKSILEELKNPDMQYALFEAQKTYARKGNNQVGDILVEALTERMKNNEETLLQITLNEAITVMSKLTSKQIDLLTLIFNAFYIRQPVFNTIKSLKDYFVNSFVKYYNQSFSTMDFQHFNYVGVAVFDSIGEKNFYQALKGNLPGIYNKGISREQLFNYVSQDELIKEYIVSHPAFEDRFLIIFGYENPVLDLPLPDNTIKILESIMMDNVLDEDEIIDYVRVICPEAFEVFDYCMYGDIKRTTLTGIGIIIAIINLRINGVNLPFEIWIK